MATQLDELSVKFSADTAGLRASLERVEVAVLKVAATTERATSRMGKAFSTVGRFISAGAIIGGITSLLRLEAALEADADALDDVAKRANIGVEALQRLRIVADENGASASAMDEALIKLQKSLGAAKSGSEELKQVFAALGLTKLITETASTEEAAYALADAIAQIKDKSQAAYVITQLLGKQGDELVGVFGEGGAALRAYAAAVEESRIRNEALNAKLAESYDKTKKNYQQLTEFGAWLAGVFVDALNAVVDAINWMIDAWNRAATAVGGYIAAAARVNAPGVTTSPGATDVAKGGGFVRGGRGLLEPDAGGVPAPSFAGDTKSPFFTGVNQGALGGIKASNGGGGSKRNEAEEAARRYAEAVSDLQFEIEQLARTEEDAAFQEELRNRLSAAGVTLASQQGQEIQNYVKGLQTARQASEAYLKGLEVDAANANRALEELRREAEELARPWLEIGEHFEDSFVDTFGAVISGAEDAGEAFRQLGLEILEVIAKQLLLNAISDAFGSSSAGGGIGGALASLFRAGGGPVNKNTPYMVGEQGPELFVPNMNGGIVPNSRMGGGTGQSFSFSTVINAPSGMNKAELEAVVAQNNKRLPKMVQEMMTRNRVKMH